VSPPRFRKTNENVRGTVALRPNETERAAQRRVTTLVALARERALSVGTALIVCGVGTIPPSSTRGPRCAAPRCMRCCDPGFILLSRLVDGDNGCRVDVTMFTRKFLSCSMPTRGATMEPLRDGAAVDPRGLSHCLPTTPSERLCACRARHQRRRGLTTAPRGPRHSNVAKQLAALVTDQVCARRATQSISGIGI